MLEPAELAELAGLARRVRVKPLWIAVPLTFYFWPVFLASVAAWKFPPDLFGKFTILLLGGVTIFWEREVIRGFFLSRRLRDDLEAGIVKVEEESDREVLPVSGMEWIVDGAAASWRGHAPPLPDGGPPNA